MPARPKLADPGALIRSGKLRTEEFRVCLDPDLVGEYEELVAQRDAAKKDTQDSLAGGATHELDAEIARVLEAMEDATVTLTLKALPRPKFRALVDKHPPRKDADGKLTHNDDYLGVHFDEFFDELIRTSLVTPQLDEADLTTLLEELLTDQQYIELTDVVWNLNKKTVNVPFSQAVSPRTKSSSRK